MQMSVEGECHRDAAAAAITWQLGLAGVVFKVEQIFDVDKLMERLNVAE